VVHYYARSIEECERKTEVFQLSPREIKERQLRGIFRDIELPNAPLPEDDDADERQGLKAPFDNRDRPRTLLEQHCFLDLDGDGYKEPYVVTISKDTGDVYRIVSRFDKITTEQSVKIEELQKRIRALAEGLNPEGATPEDLAQLQRAEQTINEMQTQIEFLAQQKPKVLKIDPVEYYTKYSFIPAPDGGFYDLGFGALLGPLNDSVNTLINQLIDSGSLQNGSVGFIGKGARIKGGKVRFSPNEWKRVNVAGATLRDSLVPLPVNQPSPVLFNLLSLLITYSERVGSVTDAMTGENPGQNTPAYNMSQMLEQGLQVFNGVFKRVYRSMRSEFRKLYKLNAIYLDQESYFSYQDSDINILRTDYTSDPKDLIPAADPNAFSSKEKLQKAQMVLERSSMVPGYNPIAVEKRWLASMDIPDVNEVFPTVIDEQGQQQYVFPPQMDPELEIEKADMQRRTLEAQVRGEVDLKLAQSKVNLDEANILKIMAEAEVAADKPELERLKLLVEDQGQVRKALADMAKIEADKQNAAKSSNEGTDS
jgi:chaperonin GroES